MPDGVLRGVAEGDGVVALGDLEALCGERVQRAGYGPDQDHGDQHSEGDDPCADEEAARHDLPVQAPDHLALVQADAEVPVPWLEILGVGEFLGSVPLVLEKAALVIAEKLADPLVLEDVLPFEGGVYEHGPGGVVDEEIPGA
ncbi:hypothetical protein DSECCO2_598460 [anaerobic digester metagenome]